MQKAGLYSEHKVTNLTSDALHEGN